MISVLPNWGPVLMRLGGLNDNVAYLRPIVELKGKLGVKYEHGDNTYILVANYTGDYQDANSAAGPRDIDEHVTFDMHYNTTINGGSSAVRLSVYNLLDEDPPMRGSTSIMTPTRTTRSGA